MANISAVARPARAFDPERFKQRTWRLTAVLAVGVGSIIFWHAVFNLGMATGLLPVVGVTLPLFSYGGSSVMTILMGVGLVMNVSMRRFYSSQARRTPLLDL